MIAVLVFSLAACGGQSSTNDKEAADNSVLTSVTRSYTRWIKQNNTVVYVADVDGDGNISILDATYIQRWLAGYSDGYRINERIA